MQQGLTDAFDGRFSKNFPLKIKAAKSTLKVTYQELAKDKTLPATTCRRGKERL